MIYPIFVAKCGKKRTYIELQAFRSFSSLIYQRFINFLSFGSLFGTYFPTCGKSVAPFEKTSINHVYKVD